MQALSSIFASQVVVSGERIETSIGFSQKLGLYSGQTGMASTTHTALSDMAAQVVLLSVWIERRIAILGDAYGQQQKRSVRR